MGGTSVTECRLVLPRRVALRVLTFKSPVGLSTPLLSSSDRPMSRLLLLVALAICPASAQVSNPVATDADLEPNSYRDSSPIAVEEVIFGERTGNASHGCELDLRLRWITEMGSGIYTSPGLADLHGDGATEILASTFTRCCVARRWCGSMICWW